MVFADPTEHSFVQSLQESTKKLNGKPVNQKHPVAGHMIVALCSQFKNSDNLMIVRCLAITILNFSGFHRFDELSSLTYNDITVHDHFLKLKIVHSKTDQYRQDNQVLIYKGNTLACPFSSLDIMFHYLS